jgi:hypothetical protein
MLSQRGVNSASPRDRTLSFGTVKLRKISEMMRCDDDDDEVVNDITRLRQCCTMTVTPTNKWIVETAREGEDGEAVYYYVISYA